MAAKNNVPLCFPGINTNFSISSEKLTSAARQGSRPSGGGPAREAAAAASQPALGQVQAAPCPSAPAAPRRARLTHLRRPG